MSNRKRVDLTDIANVVYKALEVRGTQRKPSLLWPREEAVIEILKSSAHLLDVWRQVEEHPEDEGAASALDMAEDWLRVSFSMFTGKP